MQAALEHHPHRLPAQHASQTGPKHVLPRESYPPSSVPHPKRQNKAHTQTDTSVNITEKKTKSLTILAGLTLANLSLTSKLSPMTAW